MMNDTTKEEELAKGILEHSRKYLDELNAEQITEKFFPLLRETAAKNIFLEQTNERKWFHSEFHKLLASMEPDKIVYLSTIHLSVAKGELADGEKLITAATRDSALATTRRLYELVLQLSSADQVATQTASGNHSRDTNDEFRDYISLIVGKLYKPGVLWKQKLMWQLVKEWNSRGATAGIPGSVRKELGEEKALELFREIANEIMADKDLLDKAVRDYRDFNPYAK